MKETKKKQEVNRIDTASLAAVVEDTGMGEVLLGFAQIINLMNGKSSLPKSNGDKGIEDLYPEFYGVLRNLSVFAQAELFSAVGGALTNNEVRSLKLTDIDRYMLSKHMYYDLGPIDDIKVRIIDNLPEGLKGDDLIIAKKILHMKMTSKESSVFDYILDRFKETRRIYFKVFPMIEKVIAQTVDSDEQNDAYAALMEARDIDWYGLPKPTKGEIEWVKRNHPDKVRIYGLKEPKQKEVNSAAITMKDVEALIGGVGEGLDNAGFSLADVGKFLGSAFAPARSGIIGGIIDVIKGIVKGFVLSNSDKVSAITNLIPSTITIDASLNAIAGLGDLVKTIVGRIDEFKNSNSDEKKIEIIDLIGDDIKNSEVIDSDEFVELINRVAKSLEERKKNRSKKEQEEVDNAASMIGSVIKYIAEKTNSPEEPSKTENKSGVTTQLAVIVDNDDSKTKELKSDLSSDKEQEKLDNAAIAMSPQAAFPGLASELKSEFQIDSDTPSFLNPSVLVTKEQKEKPAFILEANATNPNPQMPNTRSQVRHLIKNEILANYPFCKDIANIASKYGVSLSMHPGYYQSDNGVLQMTSIQVVAAVNEVYRPTKSFTIDLGQCLDTRIKLFFNAKASGFEYMEACSEAFKLFDDKTNNLLVPFFEKVFQMGYEGLREEDKRPYRMYNSNTLQLNRVILYITLPTGAVKGEARQALKDSAFKMMGQIKEINRINGINLGRFYVKEFEKENLSYVLTNEGSYLYGVLNSAPRFEILVVIQKDKDDKIKKDKNGKPELVYSVRYADNVFPNGFKFPDSANTIEIVDSKDKEVVNAEIIELNSPEEGEVSSAK